MPGTALIIDDELTPIISAIGLSVEHPGALTAEMAAYLLFSTQQRFQRQVGPDGQKWKPLARRTTMAKVRGRRRGAANILRVTTRLYSSLVADSGDTFAEVGTNVEYAAAHHFGAEITQYARSQRASFKKIRKRYSFVKRGTKGAVDRNITIGEHKVKIPARPYLGFNEHDRAELIAIGEDWMRRQATP
jgi:phage virion morphogenesis protein